MTVQPFQSITLPSVWNINAGCDSRLALHPFDPDGDRVECVWALNETSQNPAFKLDQLDCIIYYNATLDESSSDKSVISILIQDYGVNKTDYFSSVPVQFTTNLLKAAESDGEGSNSDHCSRQDSQKLIGALVKSFK